MTDTTDLKSHLRSIGARATGQAVAVISRLESELEASRTANAILRRQADALAVERDVAQVECARLRALAPPAERDARALSHTMVQALERLVRLDVSLVSAKNPTMQALEERGLVRRAGLGQAHRWQPTELGRVVIAPYIGGRT